MVAEPTVIQRETMSDAQGASPINKSNDGKATESDSQKTQANASTFNPGALGDEDFQKVFEDPRLFQHPRFKELNERAKLAAKLQKEQEDAENEKLKEQQKWQELATKSEEKATKLQQQLQQTLVDMKIQQEAAKLGAVDAEAVIKLIDRGAISTSDDGIVTGVLEALMALKESKGYLFAEGGTKRLGSASNPTSDANPNNKKFTLSQIQDPKFYSENEADILAAFKSGSIVNDK